MTAPQRRPNTALLLGASLLVLLLVGGRAASDAARVGLSRCSATVIPVLFPYMVIAAFLVDSGAGEWVCRPFARPMQALFGIPGAGAGALILGAVCGFPIGAKTAASLYDRGVIDRDGLSRLLCFTSNAGLGFVVGAVGSLWSSPAFGMGLYAIQLASALLIGFCLRQPSKTPLTPPKASAPPPLALCLTGAVTSAVQALLAVCAYVILFSAILGAAGGLLDRLGSSPLRDVILRALCELTSAVTAASALDTPLVGGVLCAFAVGWSGIAVHMQVLAVTAGRGLRYRGYVCAKLAQGLLCAAATALWLTVAPPPGFSPRPAIDTFLPPPSGHAIGMDLCFLLGTLAVAGKKIAEKFRPRYGFMPKNVL